LLRYQLLPQNPEVLRMQLQHSYMVAMVALPLNYRLPAS
jgi:hypothetical protein